MMNVLFKFFGCLTITLIVFTGQIFAQQSQQNLLDTYSPTPEAAALGKFGEVPISLYKGVPDVSIPIYELQLPDFTLPISLKYDASGIKVDQMATNVGLGWSLHAGGTISSTVHGNNDLSEQSRSVPADPTTFNPVYDQDINDYHLAEDVLAGDADMEADEFFYSFLDKSGKFVLSNDLNTAYPIPYEPIDIQFSNGITITDEHGVQYNFSATEITTTSETCGGGPQLATNRVFHPIVRSYNLTKITTQGGSEILFNYESYNYSYDDTQSRQKYVQTSQLAGCFDIIDRSCVRENSVTGKRLSSITSASNGITVDFNYASQQREDLPGAHALESIDILFGTEQIKTVLLNHDYFRSPSYNPSSSQEEQSLDSRLRLLSVVEQGSEPWEFEYNTAVEMPRRGSFAQDHWGYYNGENSNSSLVIADNLWNPGGAEREPNPAKIQTGLLTKVTYPTGGNTTFEYEPHDYQYTGIEYNEVPQSLSFYSTNGNVQNFTIDHNTQDVDIHVNIGPAGSGGGGRLGMGGNSSQVRLTKPDGSVIIFHAEDEMTMDLPSGNYEVRFLLDLSSTSSGSIHFGWEEFESTPITETRYNAGVRVDRISSYDPLSANEIIKTFEYDQLIPAHIPRYIDDYKEAGSNSNLSDPDTFCNYKVLSSASVPRLGGFNQNVGYGLVKEYVGENGEFGRTSYVFSTGLGPLSDGDVYNESAGNYQYNWTGGIPLESTKEKFLGLGNFTPVTRTIHTYTVYHDPTTFLSDTYSAQNEKSIYDIRIAQITPEQTDGLQFSPATFQVEIARKVSVWYHPEMVIERIYDPADSTQFVESSVAYEYANAAHTQPTAIVEINSDDVVRRTEVTYAHEILNDGTGKNYSAMGSQHNMLSQRYRTTVKDQVGTIIKSEWTRWDNPTGVWRPSEEWVWNQGSAGSNPTGSTAINTMTFTDYNSVGNPKQMIDANGAVTNLSWDATGSYLTEIEQVNPAGTDLSVKIDYNNKGLMETLWDENNKKITYNYDNLNRLDSLLNHDNELIEEYTYTLAGANFSSSNLNRILTKQYASGASTRESTQFFDGLGRLVQSQAKEGSNSLVTGITQYDEAGREWRNWKAYPQSGTMDYDASGTTNSNNYNDGNPGPDASGRAFVESIYEASPLGRPLRVNPEGVSGSAGGTLRYDYGVSTVDGHNAHWTEITDETGTKTRTWVDGWGRTVRSTAGYGTGDAAQTNFIYDELDQLEIVTSPEGLQTVYQYDKRGLLSQKTTPDSGTTDYEYDDNGNLRFLQDANLAAANRYMAYSYDFAGRVIKEETCSGEIPSSLTASCSSSQQAITYTYDNANVAPSGVSFTVNNPLGNLTKVDFQGGYYLYSYNNDGNIERMYNKLDGLSGRTITYQYNRLGEIIYRHMSGNTHRWWYTYDDLGQLDLVRTNTTTTQLTDADYGYWPGGMVQTELLGNQTISYGYDARDRLLDINNVGSSTPKFSARYTYFTNSNINVVQFHQPDSPHSQKRYRYTHTYDNRNQLTQANFNYWNGSGWSGSSAFDLGSVSYDKDGNITDLSRRFEGLNTYSYSYTSGTNRLETVNKNGSNISFGYDSNGNVTTIGTGYSITNTVYNWRNLPTSITKSGSMTYNYRYDHEGLRIYKEEGDNIHTLRGAFGEVLATYKNGSHDYWNILKPDGSVIGRREGSNRLYYHRDHLGSTRAVVNASGTVVQTYDYYPFGLEMPGRSLTSGNYARERFTGHERDEEVGLDYMQARRYAAEFGRFLSVDPLSDDAMQVGLTPYNYTWNNPTNLTDPDGRCPSCIGALVGAGLDIAFQTIVEEKSLSEVNFVSVGISAAAGATGAGIVSGVNKLRKAGNVGKVVQVASEVATDAAVSAGEQAAREGEVDLISTTSAVLFGQALRTPIRDKITSAGQPGIRGKQVEARTAERKARNASQNSTRAGKIQARRNAAESTRRSAVNAERANRNAGVAAGTTAAGVARKTVDEARKKERK
jgi:RHS repeat-associated protein